MKETPEQVGSRTAKGGFSNEKDVKHKFENWKHDTDVQLWLKTMGYVIKEIEKIKAVILHGYKTDVHVKIFIHMKDAIATENISVKLTSNKKAFNQLDKRPVDRYKAMWDIPDNATSALKLFTGETKPAADIPLSDARRINLNEMGESECNLILDFFSRNKILVLNDIFKGRGKFSAEWMLVARKKSKTKKEWVVKPMNVVMNHYGHDCIKVSPRGSLKIGRVTMQRKGGTPDPTSLQFKFDPSELFDI